MLELGKGFLAVSILRKHAPSHDVFVSRWVCLSRVSHVYCLISAILFDAMFIWKMNSNEKEKNDNYNEDIDKKEYEEGEGE